MLTKLMQVLMAFRKNHTHTHTRARSHKHKKGKGQHFNGFAPRGNRLFLFFFRLAVQAK